MTAQTGRSRYWTIWKCHELKGTHEGRSWPKWKLSSVEHCCCLLDILVVTFALLISVTDTCQPSCLLCLQCKWFWKLAALCVCLWPEFSSFLFIWHFKYFYLELSHEFLLRIILLGEELKDKNRDPSGLQTERLERSGVKPLGKLATSVGRGGALNVMKIGKIVRRDSLHGSHCSLTLPWLQRTAEGLSIPCCCLLLNLKKIYAEASGGRAVFGDDRLMRLEPPYRWQQKLPVEFLARWISRPCHQTHSFSFAFF